MSTGFKAGLVVGGLLSGVGIATFAVFTKNVIRKCGESEREEIIAKRKAEKDKE